MRPPSLLDAKHETLRIRDRLAAGGRALDRKHERVGPGSQRDPHDLVTLRLGRKPARYVVPVQQRVERHGPDAGTVKDDQRKARRPGGELGLGARIISVREESIAVESAAELQRRPGGGRVIEAIGVYDTGSRRDVAEHGSSGGRPGAIPGASIERIASWSGACHLQGIRAVHRLSGIEMDGSWARPRFSVGGARNVSVLHLPDGVETSLMSEGIGQGQLAHDVSSARE